VPDEQAADDGAGRQSTDHEVLPFLAVQSPAYDEAFSSQACANWRMSAPARAAKASMAMRVVRGRKTSPAVSPVPTATLVQTGPVTSPRRVFWRPPPLTSSLSSAGPVVPW